MVPTQKLLLVGDQNRIDSELSEKFGRSVQTVILVQQDRTAHVEREYV